jgi:predicted nucleic acid-binding protein
VLALLALIAERVEPSVTATEALDPDDNRFLECAEAAEAEFLITGNLKHYPKGLYKNTRIVNARQFLDSLSREK